MRALLIVDMQNDFMPGGALPVPDADRLIPILNKLMGYFSLIFASQDWHPSDHVSFAANHPGHHVGDHLQIGQVQQVLWPVHCVQHSKGAAFVSQLNQDKITAIFHKGSDRMVDSYSAFFDNARMRKTGLDEALRKEHVKRIYIAGVATDYCVLYTVLDALDLGYQVCVIPEACRAINLEKGDEQRAFEWMQRAGASLIKLDQIALE